jgi:hypothetical protein
MAVAAIVAFALTVTTRQRLLWHAALGLLFVGWMLWLAAKHGCRRLFATARTKPWDTLEG